MRSEVCSSVSENSSLLECDAVLLGEQFPTFGGIIFWVKHSSLGLFDPEDKDTKRQELLAH